MYIKQKNMQRNGLLYYKNRAKMIQYVMFNTVNSNGKNTLENRSMFMALVRFLCVLAVKAAVAAAVAWGGGRGGGGIVWPSINFKLFWAQTEKIINLLAEINSKTIPLSCIYCDTPAERNFWKFDLRIFSPLLSIDLLKFPRICCLRLTMSNIADLCSVLKRYVVSFSIRVNWPIIKQREEHYVCVFYESGFYDVLVF